MIWAASVFAIVFVVALLVSISNDEDNKREQAGKLEEGWYNDDEGEG